jgi:hypothetical protein
MKSKFTRVSLIGAAALAASCTAREVPVQGGATVAAAMGAPEAVVQSFYQTYQQYASSGQYGLPGSEWVASVESAITPELRDLLLRADAAESRYDEAAARLEVPPLIEGDPFSSLFEGFSAFAVEPCEGDGQQRICPVRLTYTDSSGTTEWHDAARVVQTAEGWRLADIEFRGDWDFASKGQLTGMLADVATAEPPTE